MSVIDLCFIKTQVMSTQQEKSAIEQLIKDFTNALNQGLLNQVPALFTADGISMPDGYKSTESKKLGKAALQQFTGKDFKINIQIEEIEVDNNYAFVTGSAEVRTENRAPKISRDFFALRKDGEQWKIYRYMFNNFTASV